ncbi:hypothetical protein ACJMK2_031760 [Sinanodonta woodiana]|uniref:Uncharacterized protein n=1 Tax=Sinanodonta woodiana TaxID=1069815 RepID=A0ABD3X0A5_SINWO
MSKLGNVIKADNRTTKVLVEHYDKVTSTYAVKHEQAQRNIKTYFIIGRKRKDDDQSKAAASNGEAPVHPESVAISMENPETLIRNPTESDNLMKDAGAVEGEESAGKEEPLLNHYEPKSSDANGVSPATLLTRRHSSGFYAASELSLDRIGEVGKTISLSTNPPAPYFPTDTSASAASPTATQLVILSPVTMAVPSSVTLVSYNKLHSINNNHNVFSKGCNPELPHSQNCCSNNLGNPLDAKMNTNSQSPILNGNKGNNSCGFEVGDERLD